MNKNLQDFYKVLQFLFSCDIVLGLDEGGLGVHYGMVEYWVRLRVPMAQALRLYKVSSFSEFVFFNFLQD